MNKQIESVKNEVVESRIKVKDLPAVEKELTAEEMKQITGSRAIWGL